VKNDNQEMENQKNEKGEAENKKKGMEKEKIGTLQTLCIRFLCI
jgi:hypothetical protein